MFSMKELGTALFAGVWRACRAPPLLMLTCMTCAGLVILTVIRIGAVISPMSELDRGRMLRPLEEVSQRDNLTLSVRRDTGRIPLNNFFRAQGDCHFPPPHSNPHLRKNPIIPTNQAQIAVVMSVWSWGVSVYAHNIHNWQCYCARHNCLLRILEVHTETVPRCGVRGSPTFQRHCVMASMIEDLQKPECATHPLGPTGGNVKWFVSVDGDTFVYDFRHSLTSFLPSGGQSLVFYERWAQALTMAGTYMAKVDDYAASFLMKWASSIPPNRPLRGDNPVLMIVMLEELASELYDRSLVQRCSNSLKAAQILERTSLDWIPYLDMFTACYRLSLGPKRTFEHVLIKRRGLGWARDDVSDTSTDVKISQVPYSDRTFILHGTDAAKTATNFYQVFQNCPVAAEGCFEPRLCQIDGARGNRHSTKEEEVQLLSAWNRCERLGVGHNDVSTCIANGNCTDDLTQSEWAVLEPLLQENARCGEPTWSCSCSRGIIEKKHDESTKPKRPLSISEQKTLERKLRIKKAILTPLGLT